MTKDPYRYFRVEARDLLEQLGKGILDLEKGTGDAKVVSRLLRLAHTLKGAARVVKQRDIADHCHAIEDVLEPLRDEARGVVRQQIDAVLALLDKIGVCVAALAPAPDALAPHAGETPPQDGLRTIRADVAELNAVLDGVAQVHARIAALERSLAVATRARGTADLLCDQLSSRRTRGERPIDGRTQAMADELRTTLAELERGIASSVEQMDRRLRQVQDAAEQLRLVPAAALFTPLERTVRDAAHALGRRVVFEGKGGDTRLDAELLGAMQSALLQIMRNAVAHGIESEAARIAAGKPVQGRVTVDVARRGQRVVFSCTDDGAGVDLDAVRRAAQRKGWLDTATQELDAPALLQLLMRGGLTTANEVSEVSGRGIGLDVVHDVVTRLGGEVAVRTARGKGTTLVLTLPLSIASLRALLVESAGRVMSIPLDAVRRTVRHGDHEIARTAQGESMVHDGEAIPFVALSQVLRQTAGPMRPGRFGSAVVVESGGARAAIGVDRLLGTANVVLRPLPELAPAAPVVAGASLDVEGLPQIVLDPDGLVSEARGAGALPREPEPVRVQVLVVDDSLTTRMLEKSILESAGYTVHAAVSAEDGLEQAARQRYALFLVDVEMPGMDGFTFIERTRADPALRDVPAILVTSRSSSEDRQRGEKVGARGYIVKSEFAQTEFLQQVRQLVQETGGVS